MLARKLLLAWLAFSASSLAFCIASSASMRGVMFSWATTTRTESSPGNRVTRATNHRRSEAEWAAYSIRNSSRCRRTTARTPPANAAASSLPPPAGRVQKTRAVAFVGGGRHQGEAPERGAAAPGAGGDRAFLPLRPFFSANREPFPRQHSSVVFDPPRAAARGGPGPPATEHR